MKITVGVVQDAPVFLDIQATIQKMEGRVGEAARRDCRLGVFPDVFAPV